MAKSLRQAYDYWQDQPDNFASKQAWSVSACMMLRPGKTARLLCREGDESWLRQLHALRQHALNTRMERLAAAAHRVRAERPHANEELARPLGRGGCLG